MTPNGGTFCKNEYHSCRRRVRLKIVSLTVASLIVMVLSLTIGQYHTTFVRVFEILYSCIIGGEVTPIERYVIWDLKLPRALMGAIVGATLGVSGTCMQGVLRNPLADPFTTGISSGASFGATIAILYGFTFIPGLGYQESIVVDAFVFSMIPIAVIIVASVVKRMTPASSILVGISIMFIFSSTTSLMKLLADPTDLEEVYIWGVGTLGKATWNNIWIVATISMACCLAIGLASGKLNVLASGDKLSHSLGVDPSKTRTLLLVTVAVMTATSVSFTGPIGFVGLVTPHLCRILLTSNNKYLIPASAAMGALVTLLADCASQSISAVYLPVGSVTALFGGPFFVYLLLHNKHRRRGAFACKHSSILDASRNLCRISSFRILQTHIREKQK